MADFHKILQADPLGEPWTPQQAGAKPIQNYWCQVEGQDWAVSVGRQVDNPLTPGTYIYGDLTYAKSQKGTEYWKFKSQKVPEGVQRPASTPAQAVAQQAVGVSGIVGDTVPGWFVPYGNMIRFCFDELKKMSDEPDKVIPGVGQPDPKQPKMEVVAGAPIDEQTQATLNAVFGDEVPEEL